MPTTFFISLCLALSGQTTPAAVVANDPLMTVAERSGFRSTATSDEVVAFGKRLADESKIVRVSEIGRTTEGRPIPLWVVADPPLADPAAAKASGKLVVAVVANIHAGEVDGKEAVGILLREMIRSPQHPLIKDLVLLVVPNFNPDGNDQFSKDNRPGQVGPVDGMGKRANGQGLDLNRDFVKLDAPETRALVALFSRWNPSIFLDLHTTNGSHHRYTLTYQGPLNPAGDQRIIDYTRKTFLPDVGKALKASGGWESFFYGNFEENHTLWTSYPDWPRFGTNYFGLRNRIAILSESYSYAPFKDRVLATRDFTRECLTYASAHKIEIRNLLDEADNSNTKPKPGARVSVESEAKPFAEEVKALGFVEESKNGRSVATTTPKDYPVKHVQDFVPKVSVDRPYAYLIPAKFTRAIETLQRHGVEIVELREDVTLDLEVSRVTGVERAKRPYEGHVLVKLETEPRKTSRMVEAGTILVKTSQPLGTLAVYLLEPNSNDSLATWGAFDDGLTIGGDFPVARILVTHAYAFATGPARPLPEERAIKKPLDLAALATLGGGFGGRRRGGGGADGEWLDGDHWLQTLAGTPWKVEARTGKAARLFDASAVSKALTKLPGVDGDIAAEIVSEALAKADSKKVGFLFTHDNDLYYATFDGAKAVRLSNTAGVEELATFSPDGKLVAFVRNNDLYVVAVDGKGERRLTEGGTDLKRNGKADWVYFEEIFNRNYKAFWWSPNSTHVGFLQIDDASVKNHEVVDDIALPRSVELTRYPRSGEPNPTVRFGLADAIDSKPVRWLEVSQGAKGDRLVSRVSWWPDGKFALVHVQDRAQTFVDLVKVPADPKAKVEALLRQTTKAWVTPPDGPYVLDDGSFLLTSERTGWKHLDLHGSNGKLIRAVTSGDWEVRSVERFDPKSKTVWVSATKDNPIASNLYRVSIEDGSIVRLTHAAGGHVARMNPDGSLFSDTWSDTSTPNQSALFDASGKKLRDLNKASHSPLDAFKLGSRERVQIKTRDGFVLEGEVILPPDLNPAKLYPVWFMTYGGPHTPTVADAWTGGRPGDHLLAADGIIVFRVDPRSASGKGAVATWSAYQRLGVQELEDIKDAIGWLKQRPYVDGSRIGMTGHSYGGFMTAFAMTHSDIFLCGIAGAPVTDWHDYDSIYTERFMRTPSENPQGYKASSVVSAAANLKGHLLIVHGMMDDNVSVRNTMRLVNALQVADKDFEVMVYPTSRHGILSRHYARLTREFIHKHLGGPKSR